MDETQRKMFDQLKMFGLASDLYDVLNVIRDIRICMYLLTVAAYLALVLYVLIQCCPNGQGSPTICHTFGMVDHGSMTPTSAASSAKSPARQQPQQKQEAIADRSQPAHHSPPQMWPIGPSIMGRGQSQTPGDDTASKTGVSTGVHMSKSATSSLRVKTPHIKDLTAAVQYKTIELSTRPSRSQLSRATSVISGGPADAELSDAHKQMIDTLVRRNDVHFQRFMSGEGDLVGVSAAHRQAYIAGHSASAFGLVHVAATGL